LRRRPARLSTQDAGWHVEERAMNLMWWAEHSSRLALLLLTAVATHLLMSFSQTVMHYRLGHRRLGGRFFRNHIDFHHVHYSKDHLASRSYIKNDSDGNNTPFFLIPVTLMLFSTYFISSFGMFLTQIITAFASFSAHVYLDNQYHTSGSALLRFAWLRRKQQLHFVHHTYGDSNFALMTIFGTNFSVRIEIPMRILSNRACQSPQQIAGSGQAGFSARATRSSMHAGGSNASGKSLHQYGRVGQILCPAAEKTRPAIGGDA
jgi:hypothetical protein